MPKRLVLAALVISAFAFTADEEKKKSTSKERQARFRTGIKEVKDLLSFAIKKQDQLEQATMEQFDLVFQEIRLLKGQIKLLEKLAEASELKQQLADLKIEEHQCHCHCNSNSSASNAQQVAPRAQAKEPYEHPLVLLNGNEQDNAI